MIYTFDSQGLIMEQESNNSIIQKIPLFAMVLTAAGAYFISKKVVRYLIILIAKKINIEIFPQEITTENLKIKDRNFKKMILKNELKKNIIKKITAVTSAGVTLGILASFYMSNGRSDFKQNILIPMSAAGLLGFIDFYKAADLIEMD